MPRFDGTGPRGEGPRTGRGIGRCDGRGLKGRGLGLRRGPMPEDEPTHQEIFDALMDIRDRVKRLEEGN